MFSIHLLLTGRPVNKVKKKEDLTISNHQQKWQYEEGPSKEPYSHSLLVIADLINSIHKPPALFNFRSISRDQPATVDDHPVTVKPFQFSPSETVAYEGSYTCGSEKL